MRSRKIFVSYRHDTDHYYKNLLLAWNEHKHFDFNVRDCSADVSVDSHNASVIKRVISRKINMAQDFIVIVGPKTKNCGWVRWEIMKARELEKKIIAIKTHFYHPSPNELYRAGAKWVYSFKMNPIHKALEQQ